MTRWLKKCKTPFIIVNSETIMHSFRDQHWRDLTDDHSEKMFPAWTWQQVGTEVRASDGGTL